MRAFVTGATGFIGGALARALLDQGDAVTALVRDPAKAGDLIARGATITPGDVTSRAGLAAAMRDHDVVFHLAAWYDLGVGDRARMEAINVAGTEIVLGEAAAVGVPRIVHCSTVAVLGNSPDGRVLDETAEHHGGFGSWYEETKHLAQQRADALVAEGAPIVTVMPGATYGPDDHSLLGMLLGLYARKLLVVCPYLDAGLSFVHVDDVARGIVAAGERGRKGERYILAGDNESLRGLFRRLAPVTGLKPPRAQVPAALVRASLPAGPVIAKVLGRQPGFLREGLASMTGTWMFASDKAGRELGYSFRPVEDGIPPLLEQLRRTPLR